MSNYHKTLNLIITLVLSICFSCSNENDNATHTETQLRSAFLKDKDYQTVKSEYSILESSIKTELWLEKLTQLRNLNLSESHNNLIKDLINQLQDESTDDNKISSIAVALAKITPEQDFLMMFGSLDDYKLGADGSFHDNIISLDLQHSLKNLESYSKTLKATSSNKALPDCNCSWTCDWYNNGYSNTNCNETTTGCGFLWLQSCVEKV